MTCYSPLKGWRARTVGPSGRRSIVFNPKQGFSDRPVTVPCGSCIGCRLERSRQWAIRCVHEASLYTHNCFITLTYNEDHVPSDLSLNVRDWQLFMKRVRKKYGKGRRFFHCGEYGSKNGRPHYHAIMFNLDFQDRRLFKERGDVRIDTSQDLENLWGLGFCTVGDVTFESAAYVARYITKKITGEAADNHYSWVDPVTGEVHRRKPEYTTSSNGIGRGWYEKFGAEAFKHDSVVMRGKLVRPPRYYERLLEVDDPKRFAAVKRARKATGRARAGDNTPERLKAREACQSARLARLPRGLEGEK